MGNLYQITEDDLAELERIIPSWQFDLCRSNSAAARTQIRRVQHILTSIRWEYGPPEHVQEIPADQTPENE